MAQLFQKSLFIAVILLAVLSACSPTTEPTLSGAIVPTRIATGTPTNTPTATATFTPSPTFTPSNTPTITPSPTRSIITVDIGDAFSFTDNDTLTVDDWRIQYTFVGNQGDSITVEMNTDSSRLDPLLVLVDEQGNRRIENDDATEGNDNAAIMNYVLGDDGIYTILATRRGEANSPYVGDYQLTFLRLPSNYYDPQSGISLMPIDFNTDETGSISSDSPFQSYIFTADLGDVVSIEMTRASGNLDPYLVLVNRQTRQILAENDDDTRSDTTNAFVDAVTIPEAGEYIVIATRYQGIDGNSSGDFVLRISTQE